MMIELYILDYAATSVCSYMSFVCFDDAWASDRGQNMHRCISILKATWAPAWSRNMSTLGKFLQNERCTSKLIYVGMYAIYAIYVGMYAIYETD